MKPIQQLAILVKLRQITGGDALIDDLEGSIASLLEETNVLSIICQVLNSPDQAASFEYIDQYGESLIRFMKLEAMWTLINIGYGPENAIQEIFDPQYEPIIKYMNRILN